MREFVQSPSSGTSIRIDLHCHSRASTEADEAALAAIRCPESYSEPLDVYAQARMRGMDFVTITDHDSIEGVTELLPRTDVIVGEELTCYFPQDRCKIHLLLWGITAADHAVLQSVSNDIHQVAQFVAQRRLAHAVAHPLYRQNGRLDRWHVERLLLMFKGFECLNGAHSMLHREAFEPLLDKLDEARLRQLACVHGIQPMYDQPWIKARTGGSDDHGLFNIGRTWTEFPPEARSVQNVLKCLREGRCRPGGEAGSSIKLAHNFYGVGIRYYTREVAAKKPGARSLLGSRLVGDADGAGRAAMARPMLHHISRTVVDKTRKLLGIRSRRRGTRLLAQLLVDSAVSRFRQHAQIASALRDGRAPLAEHEPMFELVSAITRDVVGGIASTAADAARDGRIGEIFDAAAAVLAQQAILLPYYFALFHQNQERHLLARLTGLRLPLDRAKVRVGFFSDVFDGDGGAARLARDVAGFASARKLDWTVHTCGAGVQSAGTRQNFEPLLSRDIPLTGSKLSIPPVLEVLQFADRGQFDVIVVNTPGPMGLCGLLAARMLRAPVVAVCHADVAAAVLSHTGGDYRLSSAAQSYARWFHGFAARLLVRSRSGRAAAEGVGIEAERVSVAPPAAPYARPVLPAGRQEAWQQTKVREPNRLLCSIDAASTGDADLLVAAFKLVCQKRGDVALVFTSDSPWVRAIVKQLDGLPVYRVEAHGEKLMTLYTSGELLLHPSRHDVCGQTVVDALAMGLPALVADAGAGGEFVEDAVTGRVLPADQPMAWVDAIVELLMDEAQRRRMARNGPQRIARLSPGRDVEALWDECLGAISVKEAADPQFNPIPPRPDTPAVANSSSPPIAAEEVHA